MTMTQSALDARVKALAKLRADGVFQPEPKPRTDVVSLADKLAAAKVADGAESVSPAAEKAPARRSRAKKKA